ncbi:nucleotidyltransferase family protein [Alteriqipengyuania sp. 357]
MTPLDPSIALVLLAAGRSRRFGSDKLTTRFQGKPLWEWAAEAAESAGFVSRYLVVGDHSCLHAPRGWHTVLNPEAGRGMGSSIAAGITAASGHQRAVIALADMPNIEAGHLRMLGEASGALFTRQADGSAGTPAAFDRESFAQLQTLTGDKGARSLEISRAGCVEPRGDRMLLDIDRPADLARED